MKWPIFLVLSGLAAAADLKQGDRIVATEEECDRLYKLNENWSTKNFHEQTLQYVDLYLMCLASLNEDKYAYIDENNVDMEWYPGDTFAVMTSEGEKMVKKPPPRDAKEEETMKEKLGEYLQKVGGMVNPIDKVMSIQSEMGQDIVDKQVYCDTLALYMLKQPTDPKGTEPQLNDCINELNCLKEKFMEQHMFKRKHYPDFFPILYKKRGVMVKTPPKLEKSACENPDNPVARKGELEKWMSGIEFIGEKLSDMGEAGTDFIQKLVQKKMFGKNDVLTKNELDDLMTDVQSVTITDDDGDDDDENTFKVYGDVMLEKLAELQTKGVDIAHAQLEKAKPAIETVQNIASLTGGKLSSKLKPSMEKTAQVFEKSNLKEKAASALGEVKDGLMTAKNVAAIAKDEGSDILSKLREKIHENTPIGDTLNTTEKDDENLGTTNDDTKSTLNAMVDGLIKPNYLPDDYDETQVPSLLQILKNIGGQGDYDKLSDGELKKRLKSLKEVARKRAAELHLTKDKIEEAANVARAIMHTLLSTATQGNGITNHMDSKEIEKAKAIVDRLVDYAKAELQRVDKKPEEDEDDDDDDDDDDESDEGGDKVKQEKPQELANDGKSQGKTTEIDEGNDKVKQEEPEGDDKVTQEKPEGDDKVTQDKPEGDDKVTQEKPEGNVKVKQEKPEKSANAGTNQGQTLEEAVEAVKDQPSENATSDKSTKPAGIQDVGQKEYEDYDDLDKSNSDKGEENEEKGENADVKKSKELPSPK